MRQNTLSSLEKYTRKSRKERFLEEMDRIVPWRELAKALQPC
jgi:transposase, IS5 family